MGKLWQFFEYQIHRTVFPSSIDEALFPDPLKLDQLNLEGHALILDNRGIQIIFKYSISLTYIIPQKVEGINSAENW